jgi:uncharacterized protein
LSVGPYRAPWWLPGGNTQTLYAALAARRPRVAMRTSRWETRDGDAIRVDALEGDAHAPLVVMFHGLEGSVESHYVQALAAELQAIGWRLLVPHWRGCGGLESTAPRAYHSGDSDEGGWVLGRAKALAADAPFFAVGVSLGGNVLLKYLGEQGAHAQAVVDAAVAVSAPVDLAVGGRQLERGFGLFYAWMFLATMKKNALGKLARHPRLFDEHALRRARTLRAFDDAFTAPVHGFRDAEDYWARASSKPLLDRIEVPTLLVHARNDPFMPGEHLPEVTIEHPDAGGHVGFVSGPFPGSLRWLPLRIIAFLRSRLAPHAS